MLTAHSFFLSLLSVAISFAFTIQCEREEEVGARLASTPFPPLPDIYVKLTVALFFEIKAFKKHFSSSLATHCTLKLWPVFWLLSCLPGTYQMSSGCPS